MKLLLATNNKHKVKEMTEIFADMDYEIISPKDIGLVLDVDENGTTFAENAMIKARAVHKDGYISVADDSGLCVNALNGQPGIYSARYAGEPKSDEKNNSLLLKNLEDKDDRSAYFVSAIACVLPDGQEFTVRGIANGIILKEAQGQGGFGYDPLFFFPELNKTFAQLTTDEKNAVSHRGNALRTFATELSKHLK